MQKVLLLLLYIAFFTSCKSSSRASASRNKAPEALNKNIRDSSKIFTLQDSIIQYAKSFEGVKYKWGGTTQSGMDCSGLIYESFREHHIYLPRISRDMAKKGKKLDIKNVQEGDLLFFKTGKSKRQAINHVGLVVEVAQDGVKFIHATNRNGVIITQLSESYWSSAFQEARRYLSPKF
ncbi:C40 family peptidase [Aestuariivivens sediminicola]|uniref:C40 family peptidase n=1 Tax=Aestuariivivens sediminicola TaxID=2913560 RepID=UPI001F5A0DAE|nr:C40 family peptidase [Aestuariivivens sediminicola]